MSIIVVSPEGITLNAPPPPPAPAAKRKGKYPTRPNTRTRANLVATAEALREFNDIRGVGLALALDYQSASERIKILRDSGLYDVEVKRAERIPGTRGALPKMYRAVAKPVVESVTGAE
jgi:hypothetical protein